MIWGLGTPSPQKKARDVPPTPGVAAWALSALPTIWAGTPKVNQDDHEVYSVLANKYQAMSTPLAATKLVNRQAAPQTPSRLPDSRDNVAGILKTPGTVGKSKNVAFANAVDGTTPQMSRPTDAADTTQPGERPRSGLPGHFPGKFPSPWTPKTISILDELNTPGDETPLTQLTNRNTATNQTHRTATNETHRAYTPADPLTPIAEATLDSDLALSAVKQTDIDRLVEESRRIRESQQRFTQSNDDFMALVDTVNSALRKLNRASPGDSSSSAELQAKVGTAMDYARVKDDEATEYRAQLAKVMEQNAEVALKYQQEISLLKTRFGKEAEPARAPLTQTDKHAQDRITQLEKLVNTQAEAIQSERSHSAKLAESLEELRKDHRALSAENMRLESRKTDSSHELLTQLSQVRESLSSAESASRRELASRDEKIRQLERELASKQTPADKKQGLRLTLFDDDSEKDDEIKSLETRLTSTQRLLDMERRRGNELEAKIAKLESELAGSRGLQDKQVKLNATTSDLNAHISLLGDQLRRKSRQLEDLQQKLDTNNSADVEELRANNTRLLNRVRELEAAPKTYNGAVENLHRPIMADKENSHKMYSLERGILPKNGQFKSDSDSDTGPMVGRGQQGLLNLPPMPLRDISMKDATSQSPMKGGYSIRDITMKDVSYNSTRSSAGSNAGDLSRREASMRRLAERRNNIRSGNSSRMSIE